MNYLHTIAVKAKMEQLRQTPRFKELDQTVSAICRATMDAAGSGLFQYNHTHKIEYSSELADGLLYRLLCDEYEFVRNVIWMLEELNGLKVVSPTPYYDPARENARLASAQKLSNNFPWPEGTIERNFTIRLVW